MTRAQSLITVALCVLATMATRFLPFLLFSEKKPTPAWIRYLGRVLPPASFAMLIVYSLRHVDLGSGRLGLPEGLAMGVTALLYFWKKKMILPVAGGSLTYLLLIHFVF